MNKTLKSSIVTIGALIASFVIAGCGAKAEADNTANYYDATANSIYGKISDYSKTEVKPGDTLTFKVTPSEDFFIATVTNNGKACKRISVNPDGSQIYSTEIVAGRNKLMASYDVDASVDFVDKFKLNISDEVFDAVMNPVTYADKKQALDFRRCGIEQVMAPFYWNNGVKTANSDKHESGYFINYVDGDTTHVVAKNLGYTIKIRYLGIDTPESTSEIEKWGLSASYYNNYVYSSDATIAPHLTHVPDQHGITSLILVGQELSMKGEKVTVADLKIGSSELGSYPSTTDGNQRNLAYVWYSTAQNPTKDTFRCLNLEMVYQGFSFGNGSIEDMGDYFYRYFDKAQLSAKMNQRHLYSQDVDPNYYDYENPSRYPIYDLTLREIYESCTVKNDGMIGYVPQTSPYYDKKTLYRVHGYVTRKVGTSFYMQDKTSYEAGEQPYGIYVFTYSETPIKTGDEVDVVGAVSVYGGTFQIQGISYHTLNPDPIRDTIIKSRGNKITPIEVTGAEFNQKKYPEILVKITDTIWCYDFTSEYGGEISSLGEGGSQEINKYNPAYPFYNTSNSPIFYAAYGDTDNCETLNQKNQRYENTVIRFTVDQEILVSHGVETCYSYRFFTGGSYLFNMKGAEYANYDESNPYKDQTVEYTFKRKKMTSCTVISIGYESTGGNRKMTAKIASGRDVELEEIA